MGGGLILLLIVELCEVKIGKALTTETLRHGDLCSWCLGAFQQSNYHTLLKASIFRSSAGDISHTVQLALVFFPVLVGAIEQDTNAIQNIPAQNPHRAVHQQIFSCKFFVQKIQL